MFVAQKNIKDNYFCITNERVLIYDKKMTILLMGI